MTRWIARREIGFALVACLLMPSADNARLASAEELLPPRAVVRLPPTSSRLSLLDALERGLASNPDLIALRAGENVGRAVLGVAQTYPFDPILQTRILPFTHTAGGGHSSVYNYVLFWQTFELAHQQRYRERGAAALLQSTRWTIAQAEVQNVALTEQLFFAALYQRGLWELARETARLNERLLDVTERRRQAGAAAAIDVTTALLDARAGRRQLRLAESTYRTALEALRRQLNLPLDAPLELAGDLRRTQWLPLADAVSSATGGEGVKLASPLPPLSPSPPLEKAAGAGLKPLAAKLAAARPDVLAARAIVASARANLGLARAARVPDLQAGPFYNRDASGTLLFGLQAQMAVPVINGGRSFARQRQAELEQQRIIARQLETRAAIEAQTALRRYQRARRLLGEDRGPSPRLPDELRRLEMLYRQGKIDAVRVIQARTSLIQLRRAQLDLLNEVAQAAAAVTGATGLPPHVLLAASPPRGRAEPIKMRPPPNAKLPAK